MHKEITLGNLITIISVIIIPLIIWGISVERRFAEQAIRIQANERVNTKIELKLDEVNHKLTDILVELQNKKDRDK